MGLLASAGMISGAGNAVNKGLDAMQDDIRRAGLSQEDRAFQMKKLQVQQDFENQREQRGYAHTEQMAKQNQNFQAAQNEGNHQATAAENEIKRTQDSIEKDKDRGLQERKLNIEDASQKSTDAYHKGIVEAYKMRASNVGAGNAYKDLSAAEKAHFDSYQKEGDSFMDLAKAAFEKEEKDAYVAKAMGAYKRARALVGGVDEAPAGMPDLSANDPFATSPLSGKGQKPTTVKPTPLLQRAEPHAPPVSYDQRAQEQLQDPRFDQLKRYLEQPSGPPAQPGPGVTLPNAQ